MKIVDLFEDVPLSKRREYGKKVTKSFDDAAVAFSQYKKKIQPALEAYARNSVIWRGIPSNRKIIVVDPTKVERKAANTSNYMNLLQSNLPSWQGFPPRNRALVCSADYGYAELYSARDGFSSNPPYVVLPIGNPLIGIVPADDWFNSYKSYRGPSRMNMDLEALYEIVQYTTNQRKIGKLPEDKAGFFKTLKQMDAVIKTHKKEILQYMETTEPSAFIKKLLKYPTLIEGLDAILDPGANKFQAVHLSQYNLTRKNEIWFSAPAVLIKEDTLKKLLKIDK